MNPAPSHGRRLRSAASRAFTLVEMMVTVFVFSFVIAGLVYVQIFGLRIYTLSATKLTATTGARQTLNKMRDQIRSAKIVLVGNYTAANGYFIQASNGTPQIGNAMALSYTNNSSTNFLVYYLDTTLPTNTMFCVTNGVYTVMAKYITNYYCFDAEDHFGNVLSNYLNNPVIHIVMDFDQWEYPIAFIGTNGVNAYDFYELQTRVTRRSK
jgi:prepilin-type N-terminal cleavage/methylation domain-containing protein